MENRLLDNIVNKGVVSRIMATALLLCVTITTFSGCGTNTVDDLKSVVLGDAIDGMTMEQRSKTALYTENGTSFAFKTSGNSIQQYDGNKFNDFYSIGVNIGSGKPNYFPGELAITKEEYLRWFEYISLMGANTIRVYTIMKPQFYDALYEFNNSSEKKLYLYQGCWYDENILYETYDAYSLLSDVKTELKDLVDVIHGQASLKVSDGRASGVYTHDVSPYVIGWILGIESDAEFVNTTNENNSDKKFFHGDYLFCEETQPFETFWCIIGDYILTYEDKNYHMQRPISFTNWLTTDVIKHTNEPNKDEDAASLTVENLHAGRKFKSGLFASYHVYPYYPNFIYSDEKYVGFRDENGNQNPYRAYLRDLMSQHTYPVIVAEFGAPTSRGIAHINDITQFNHGGVSEEKQGQMIVSMMEDIKAEGYAGALIFSWQDEWFKRVWNFADYNNSDRRPYWNDTQNCEGHYGLMGFNPTDLEEEVIVDGKLSEWKYEDAVLTTSDSNVYAKSDSAYLYIAANLNDADSFDLYFDINPNIGSSEYNKVKLSLAADNVLHVDGKDDTRLLVQRDSDNYYYLFNAFDLPYKELYESNNTNFAPIYSIIEKQIKYPNELEDRPVMKVESGKLLYGTTDMADKNYNSLTDFCIKDGVFEARIPWLMLGFSDPSTKEINAFCLAKDDGVSSELISYSTQSAAADARYEKIDITKYRINIDGINIGLIKDGKDLGCGEYTWDNWNLASYEEYLKPSYYIVQEYLENHQLVQNER